MTIKQNEIKRLREASKKVIPAVDLDNIEPIIASNDGYILTKDGRILMRMAVSQNPVRLWRSETKDLGLDTPGITPDEAFAYISRIAGLPLIEDSAMEAQRTSVLLRRALLDLFLAAQAGKLPTPKQIVAASMALRESET